MKKNIQFYLGVIIIFISSCVSDEIASTGSVTGIIKDASTTQPLQGCLVTLSPSGKAVSTGSDGLYSFSDLSPETYSIEIQKTGYAAEKKETTITAGNVNKVDVFLIKETEGLSVTPEVLNFGELETSKEFYISNKTTSSSISYTIKANADWIYLSSTEGVVSSNTSKIKVVIERESLSIGEYEKGLSITSPVGEVIVPVIVKQVEKTTPKIGIGDFDNITESSFSVKGIIHSTGGLKITSHGHCWSENELPTIEGSSKTNFGDTEEIGDFTSQITQLITGKTYYVRAYAVNSKGVSYSEQISITMPYISIPMLNTKAATGITSEKAFLNGEVLNNGGSNITEYGFYYGITENPTTKNIIEGNIADFKIVVENLIPGQTYYYKAYAINAKGIGYGEILTFKTRQEGSSTETSPPTKPIISNISGNSATAISSISLSSNDIIIEAGMECSKDYYFRNSKGYKKFPGTVQEDGTLTVRLTDLYQDFMYDGSFVRAYIITEEKGELISKETYFSFKW
ncbi:hypothetical protein M2138_001789 [Dysgonomonadaceae bacterium PH5-43]|nr:hypothetical protein [Dysgonomonadaceae bacterium PH5-43]